MHKKSKVIFAIILVVAVALIGTIAIFNIFIPTKISKEEDKSAMSYTIVGDNHLFFQQDGAIHQQNARLDHMYIETYIPAAYDNTMYLSFTSTKDLYIFTDNGLVLVDKDVFNYQAGNEGKSIVYQAFNGKEFVLYLYDVKSKESKKLADNIKVGAYAISPDGKTVIYEENGDCKIFINGKEQKDIIANASPIAVTNNGKLVYYIHNNVCYVNYEGNRQKIGETPTVLHFNKDFTELIYSNEEATEFYINGKKINTSKFNGGALKYFVLPEGKFTLLYKKILSGVSVKVLPNDSLKNMVTVFDYGLYYINDKYDLELIEMSIDDSYSECSSDELYAMSSHRNKEPRSRILPWDVYMSQDENSLFFSKDQVIYRVDDLKKSRRAEQYSTEITMNNLYPTSDFSAIYYVNADNQLMYYDNKNEPIMIAQDSFLQESFMVSGDTLYFIGDCDVDGRGTIYSSINGSLAKAISESDQVMGSNLGGDSLFYWTDSTIYYYNGETSVQVQ